MEKTIIGMLALLLVIGMTGCSVQNKGAGQAALKSPQTKIVTPSVSQAVAGDKEPPASPPGTAEPPLAPEKMLEDVVERMEDYRFYTGYGNEIEAAKIPITSKKIKREMKEYLKNISLQKPVTMYDTEENKWYCNGVEYDWLLVVENLKNGSKYVVWKRPFSYVNGGESYGYAESMEDRIEVTDGINHTYYMVEEETDNEKILDKLSRYVGRQLYGKTVKGKIIQMGWPEPPFQEIGLENPEYGYMRIRCKNVYEGMWTGDEVEVQFPKAKKKDYYLNFKQDECIIVKQVRQAKN